MQSYTNCGLSETLVTILIIRINLEKDNEKKP